MDNTLKAIAVLNDLIALSLRFVSATTEVATLIQAARDAGRDLTEAEWQQITTADDAARADLDAAIRAAELRASQPGDAEA